MLKSLSSWVGDRDCRQGSGRSEGLSASKSCELQSVLGMGSGQPEALIPFSQRLPVTHGLHERNAMLSHSKPCDTRGDQCDNGCGDRELLPGHRCSCPCRGHGPCVTLFEVCPAIYSSAGCHIHFSHLISIIHEKKSELVGQTERRRKWEASIACL